jgi:hypothetical protein
LNKRPIEKVSIECHENEWLCLFDVLKEFDQEVFLILLIENFEKTINAVLGLWVIFKILDVITNDIPVCDQESLAINDV